MSRYFQSTYHSSNDYKKYKQEKYNQQPLAQNYSNPNYSNPNYSNPNYSNPNYSNQNYSNQNQLHITRKKIQSSFNNSIKTNQKQITKYLHTFGMDTKTTDYAYNTERNKQSYETQRSRQFTNDKYQRLTVNNINKNRNNTYQHNDRQDNTNYQRQTSSIIKKNIIPQNVQYQKRYLMKPTDEKQNQDFEDKIINRRRNYVNSINSITEENYQNKPQQPRNQQIRHYTNKLTFRDQKHQNQNKYQSRRPKMNNNNMTIEYRAKPLQEHKTSQRAEDKYSHYDHGKVSNFTPGKRQNRQVNEEKMLSEQRRKSLIEKSQTLKEKLNKLHSNNLKKPVSTKNNNQSEDNMIESRNYSTKSTHLTPNKYDSKYLAVYESSDNNNIKKTNENLHLFEQNMNKKLNLQQFSIKPQTNIQFLTHQTSPYNSNNRFDDPIRKISALNQKINDRLQAILKNYG